MPDPDRIPREAYWREYDQTYASLPIEGAAVIDVGADYGSSPEWFLMKGASHVYAFESDEELAAEMREKFKGDRRVDVVGAWNGQQLWADVLKMDCEGCERNLTVEYLAGFKAFAVALHKYWISPQKYWQLRAYMVSVRGAKLVQDLDKEEMFVATR